VYKSRLRSLRIARLVSVTAGFSSYLLASIRGLIRGSTPILRIGVACLACPLGLLQLAAASFTISSVMLVGVLTALTLALFLGRIFCGWICPTGLVATEIVRVRRSKEWVLAIVIAASTILSSVAFRIPVFCLICPIGLPYKLVVMAVWGRDPYSLLILALASLVGVVVLSRWVAYWCGALCPVGILLGLVGSRPLLRIEKQGECTNCRLCDRVCPSGIHAPSMRWRERVSCTLCLKCVHSCPMHALKLSICMPLIERGKS